MMKIVFIGGLTNGKIVYDYLQLNKHVDLALTITYPDEATVARAVKFPDIQSVIKDISANKWVETIKRIAPDLIIVAGWSELLSDQLLEIAPLGTIGFHPSKLPHDRGRSVLAWQIEEGYTETALSMFYYNNIPDGGDIIAQENFAIHPTDYVNEVLNKIDKATYNIMRAYFPLIRMGKAPRLKQDINIGSFRRLRSKMDDMIDLSCPVSEILNKIRAISRPYPGAVATIEGIQYRIWRAEKVTISNDDVFTVKCRDGYLKITDYEPIK